MKSSSPQESPPSTWTCPYCTLENPSRRNRCGVCEKRRPVDETGISSIEISPKKEKKKSKRKSSSSTVTSWLRKRNRKRKGAPNEESEKCAKVRITVSGESFGTVTASLPPASGVTESIPDAVEATETMNGDPLSVADDPDIIVPSESLTERSNPIGTLSLMSTPLPIKDVVNSEPQSVPCHLSSQCGEYADDEEPQTDSLHGRREGPASDSGKGEEELESVPRENASTVGRVAAIAEVNNESPDVLRVPEPSNSPAIAMEKTTSMPQDFGSPPQRAPSKCDACTDDEEPQKAMKSFGPKGPASDSVKSKEELKSVLSDNTITAGRVAVLSKVDKSPLEDLGVLRTSDSADHATENTSSKLQDIGNCPLDSLKSPSRCGVCTDDGEVQTESLKVPASYSATIEEEPESIPCNNATSAELIAAISEVDKAPPEASETILSTATADHATEETSSMLLDIENTPLHSLKSSSKCGMCTSTDKEELQTKSLNALPEGSVSDLAMVEGGRDSIPANATVKYPSMSQDLGNSTLQSSSECDLFIANEEQQTASLNDSPEDLASHSINVEEEQKSLLKDNATTAERAIGLSEPDKKAPQALGAFLSSDSTGNSTARPQSMSQDLGIAQIMTQQAGDFLYTQMSQPEDQERQLGASQASENSPRALDCDSKTRIEATIDGCSANCNVESEYSHCSLDHGNAVSVKAKSLEASVAETGLDEYNDLSSASQHQSDISVSNAPPECALAVTQSEHSAPIIREEFDVPSTFVRSFENAFEGQIRTTARTTVTSSLPMVATASSTVVDIPLDGPVSEGAFTSEGGNERTPSRIPSIGTLKAAIKDKNFVMEKETNLTNRAVSDPGFVPITSSADHTISQHNPQKSIPQNELIHVPGNPERGVAATKSRHRANQVQKPSFFQTAGKQTSLTVSSTSLTKAKHLLEGSCFNREFRPGDGGTTGNSTALHSAPAQISSQPAIFKTAGKQTEIAVSSECMAMAEAFLHKSILPMDPAVAAEGILSTVQASKHTDRLLPIFQTAGKQTSITVSTESLAKAKQVLERPPSPIDDFLSKEGTPSAVQTTRNEYHKQLSSSKAVFQTAGTHREIKVSPESTANAEQMLQKSRPSANPGGSLKNAHSAVQTSSYTCTDRALPAFQTAGKHTPIVVSDESLAKATLVLERSPSVKKDFQSAEASMPSNHASHSETQPQSFSLNAVFKTAGKLAEITVSSESMAKAEQMMDNPNLAENAKKGLRDIQTGRALQRLPLFHTAGQQTRISVSAENLAKATYVLETPPSPARQYKSEERTTYTIDTNHNEAQPHFISQNTVSETAGKPKEITASSGSLEKAEHMLAKPLSATDPAATVNDGLHALQTGKAVPSLPLFQTTGKQTRISVSAESLAKANHVLDRNHSAMHCFRSGEGTDCANHSSNNLAPMQFSSPKADFKTAGEQAEIAVSSESMAKAEGILKKNSLPAVTVVDGLHAEQTRMHRVQPPPFFQTAGKQKTVHVSAESLAKVSHMLERSTSAVEGIRSGKGSTSTAYTNLLEAPLQSFSHTTVFKTAGKKIKIQVSPESIAKAGEMLEKPSSAMDPAVACNDSLDAVQTAKQTIPQPPLFQTANKQRTIMVSEESLVKANDMLARPSSTANVDLSEKDSTSAACASLQEAPPQSFSNSAFFKTAGKQSKIQISPESLVKAGHMLEKPSPVVNPSVADDLGLLDSQKGKQTGQSPPLFQTAGKRTAIIVSANSLANANHLLEQRTSTECLPSQKTIVAAETGETGKTMATTAASPASTVEGLHQPRLTEEKVVSTSCKSAIQNSQHFQDSASAAKPAAGKMTTSVTRTVAERTESNHKDRSEHCDAKDVTVREESAFIDTFRGDRSRRAGRPPLLQDENLISTAHVSLGTRIKPPPDCSTMAPHAFKPKESSDTFEESAVSESEKILLESSTLAMEELPHQSSCSTFDEEESTLTQTFTPKPHAACPQAVIMMSASVKNPYHRKRSKIANETEGYTENFSPAPVTPIPFNFSHIEGRFRGENVSPTSLSHAKRILDSKTSQQEAASTSRLSLPTHRDPPHGTQKLSPQKGCENSKKVVKWTLDEKGQSGTLALSQYAAQYGEMADDATDCLRLGVQVETIEVDSLNATKLRFDANSGLPCCFSGDDNSISGQNAVGNSKELLKALKESGCDKKTLTERWVLNHTRWIVWKLASMERRFPKLLACRYLTYDHLVSQLRKRYEKEFRDGERSSLRKVLNRDVAPSCLMILCVSNIFRMADRNSSKLGESRVELTDGWYSTQACLDMHLTDYVKKGTIKVGSKLLICNASMKGAEDGIDPLDPSYSSTRLNCSVLLGLTVNATRPARWDAKLGFVAPSLRVRSHYGLLLVRSISHILPGGGSVPLIDLIVCRKYPQLFLEHREGEKKSESSESKSTVLSSAQEDIARKEFEKCRQRHVEQISERIQKECEKEVDEEAPALWKELLRCSSPSDFYERLAASEKISIDKWREQRDALLQDRVRKEVEAEIECDSSLMRESTPFVRVLVKAFDKYSNVAAHSEESSVAFYTASVESESALLTVWNESEEQHDMLKEGNVIRVRNLSVRSTKRDGLIQLTAGRKTPMEVLSSHVSPGKLASMGYRHRCFLSLFRVQLLSKKLFNESIPHFPAPEVDAAGVVVKVVEEVFSTGGVRFHVYITDESGLLLRVECDEDVVECDTVRSLSTSAQQNVEKAVIVAFHDIRVMPFDRSDNCAVGVFAETSSTSSPKLVCRKKSDLLNWSKSPDGERLLSILAACIDGGVPMLKDSMATTPMAVGYIAGFAVLSECSLPVNSDLAPLQILVDCGCTELQVWEFPLSLLDDALRLCGDSNEAVAVKLEEERIHLHLKYLGRMFRGSGVLLHFILCQKPQNMQLDGGSCGTNVCVYQVQQLRKANSHALAGIYTSSLKYASDKRINGSPRIKRRQVAIPLRAGSNRSK